MGQQLLKSASLIVPALREQCEAQGVSLRALTERTNYPKSSLSRWFNNPDLMPLTAMIDLSLSINRDPRDILSIALSGVGSGQKAGGAITQVNSEIAANEIAAEIWQVVTRKLAHSADRPSGQDLMIWWRANSGRLEYSGAFSECYDLYHEPDGDRSKIRAAQLGKRSLASLSLGVSSPELLWETVAPLGEGFRMKILKAHDSVLEQGPVTTIETLDAEHPQMPGRIQVEYFRTLLPVTDASGLRCVLNYSELLGKPRIVTGHVDKV